MKSTKIYRPKALISGTKLPELIDSKEYVAIPDRGYKDAKVIVEYKGVRMTIPNWHKAIIFKRFHDQFRAGSYYTLGYFEFVADEKQPAQYEIVNGMARLKND